jgi:hypothetical protein
MAIAGEHADLVGTACSTPHRRDPCPQSTHQVLREFPAQTPVSGLAGGAQNPAEGMGSHLGAHLTEFVQQPLRERLPRRRWTPESRA